MPKTLLVDEEVDKKSIFICPDCKTEFKGKECPQCGNTKTNLKLAPDGIEQRLHGSRTVFGSLSRMQTTDQLLNDESMMEAGRAKLQVDEMNDNLRQTYVYKSEISKKEKEMELLKKQAEYNRLSENLRQTTQPQQQQQNNPYQQQQAPDFAGFNMSGSMSPQAMFLSKFLKMDSKERSSFLESLDNADPETLQKLNTMFYTPQMPMMMGGQQGYYQNPYMMPPWMMQQQQPREVQQQPQTDPIALVTAIFELSQKMQPQKDDSMKDTLRELKDEIKRTQDRIENMGSKQNTNEMKPVLDKINSIELQLASSPQNKKTVGESISEISQIVTGLTDLGLVSRPGHEGKTVDDELKLKEFEFKKEVTLIDKNIEQQRLSSEQNRQDMSKQLVSTLFQRGLHKAMLEKNPQEKGTQVTKNITQPSRVMKPQEIISQIDSDAGTIKETKSPVRKEG